MARTPEDSINVSEKFRYRLIEIIEEHDFTKKNFSEYVGVNKEIILRATKYAIIPSVKSLLKIADTLQYPIDYVLGENNDTDFTPSLHPTDFKTRITELCEEKHTTYTKLANVLPFAPNAVYQWVKNDGLPSIDYLKLLANYFEVSSDYLLGRTDYRN